MGQSLRRAAGRARTSTVEPSPHAKNVERPPKVVPAEPKPTTDGADRAATFSDPEVISSTKNESDVLEERDPGFDAMLSKMVGRITSKPGGKLEMGEAFIVEKYNRPMPKLRTTKADASRDEQKAVPPGTLNIAQLRHILLLHQGKAEDHDGPMEAHQIAEKFRIEVAHVQRILQFVSLPPKEDSSKN